MKKIILLVLSLFLISCNNSEIVNEKLEEVSNNKVVDTSVNSISLTIEENENKLDNLKNKIDKLNDLWLEEFELEDLIFSVDNLYKNKILNKVKTESDISLCEKLEEKDLVECKIIYAVDKLDYEICKNFSNETNLNNCNNRIIYNQLSDSENSDLCNNLLWVDEIEINSCKDNYNRNKAFSTLDKMYCEKINEEIEKNMCNDMVNMEIEMKKELEKMQNN